MGRAVNARHTADKVRTVPAPVRAAQQVLDDIKPHTDPQDWNELRRVLPVVAMRLAASGQNVEAAVLHTLATGPRDELRAAFNAAAADDKTRRPAALRFDDLPQLFDAARVEPKQDADQNAQRMAIEAALRAQDVPALRTALGGGALLHTLGTAKACAILDEVAQAAMDTAIDAEFFAFLRDERCLCRIEDRMTEAAPLVHWILQPQNRALFYTLAAPRGPDGRVLVNVDVLQMLQAAVLAGAADVVDHMLHNDYPGFSALRAAPMLRARITALNTGQRALFNYMNDVYYRRYEGNNPQINDMIDAALRRDAVDFLGDILDRHEAVPDMAVAASDHAAFAMRNAIKIGAPACLRALIARGVPLSGHEEALRMMIDQGGASDESQARMIAVFDVLDEAGGVSYELAAEYLRAVPSRIVNKWPLLQHVRRKIEGYYGAEGTPALNPAGVLLRWHIDQIAALQSQGPQAAPIIGHLCKSLLGDAGYSARGMMGWSHKMAMMHHYMDRRRDEFDQRAAGMRDAWYGRSMMPMAGEGIIEQALSKILESAESGQYDDFAVMLNEFARDIERLPAVLGDQAAPTLKMVRGRVQKMAVHIIATRKDYDELAQIMPCFGKGLLDMGGLAYDMVDRRAWGPLLWLTENYPENFKDAAILQEGSVQQNLRRAYEWRRVLPDRFVDQALFSRVPQLLRPAAYHALAGFLSKLHGEDIRNRTGAERIYDAAVIFRSEERMAQYIARYANRQNAIVNEMASLFTFHDMKLSRQTDLGAWGDALLRFGPPVLPLLAYADRLHKPAATLNETRALAAQYKYKGGERHPALAGFCMQYNVSQNAYDCALQIIAAQKDKPAAVQKNLPAVTIDGADIGVKGLRFAPLPPDDWRGLFLGKIVDCCQHIDSGNAQWCAEHGFMSPEGAFYVITTPQDEIVGMSWAWRGTDGELVFDSLETLGRRVSAAQWQAFMEEFARRAVTAQPDITAILTGTDGQNIPSLQNAITPEPAVARDHKGYPDSHRQHVLWAADGSRHNIRPPEPPPERRAAVPDVLRGGLYGGPYNHGLLPP